MNEEIHGSLSTHFYDVIYNQQMTHRRYTITQKIVHTHYQGGGLMNKTLRFSAGRSGFESRVEVNAR